MGKGPFRVIGGGQGCPANEMVAPYFEIIRRDVARRHPGWGKVNSVYRGENAKAILHAHGLRTQGELIAAGLPAAAEDESTHCLRNDGRAYPNQRRKAYLQWWQQGLDTNDEEVALWKDCARARGWELTDPYHTGSEKHHLNFAKQPRPMGPRTRALIIYWRLRLPDH